MTKNRKYGKFETMVREGFKAREMYAPVAILTPRQYVVLKNRESKPKLNKDK